MTLKGSALITRVQVETRLFNYSHRKNNTYTLSAIMPIREVEAFKFVLLPLPAPLQVLCFQVRFCFLIFGIFASASSSSSSFMLSSSLLLPHLWNFSFRFLLQIELVASNFASASSLFHQSASASASTKI